jgi:hypothetical protein
MIEGKVESKDFRNSGILNLEFQSENGRCPIK